MSNTLLIDWIEGFLFGSSSPCPPQQLTDLILRMEAENIPWADIIRKGGFTSFAYQVHGDLDSLIDALEAHYEPRPFKTRAVTRFWNELQMLLAKREPRIPLIPCKRDDDILKDMLEGGDKDYEFQSAAFWGEVARSFINLRRPKKTLLALPSSDDNLKRIKLLYDVTCESRGQLMNPLNMCMVPRSEYVNAAHWQSGKNLQAFMHYQPSHPLTLSVQALLNKTVHELLHGEKPSSILNPCPQLDALLHNVRVIHESVQQVPNGPPKLIDVFQRLLALCHRDALWEKDVPAVEPTENLEGTNLLYLTEQLLIVENEKYIFRTIGSEIKSVPRPHEHICSAYRYANYKHHL